MFFKLIIQNVNYHHIGVKCSNEMMFFHTLLKRLKTQRNSSLKRGLILLLASKWRKERALLVSMLPTRRFKMTEVNGCSICCCNWNLIKHKGLHQRGFINFLEEEPEIESESNIKWF